MQNSSEQSNALSKYEGIWASYQAKYESKEKVRLLRSKEEQLHTVREHSTSGIVMPTVHTMHTCNNHFRCPTRKADSRAGTGNSCYETESRWESLKSLHTLCTHVYMCIHRQKFLSGTMGATNVSMILFCMLHLEHI